MKKKPASKSAFFNQRVLIAFSFCLIGLVLALAAFNAYPGGNAVAAQQQVDAQAIDRQTAPEPLQTPDVIGVCDTAGPVEVEATAGTLGPTAYPNLAAAIAAINLGTHQGVINVEICGSTVETATMVLHSSGAGAASYTSVLIRPLNNGLTVAGPTLTGRGLIELNGADNVTIDGDNPNSAGINRNLTIQNTAADTVTFTSVVRIALAATIVTSADNVTIKNCNITGSSPGRNVAAATTTSGTENTTFGIFAGPGASTVSATTDPSPIASVSAGVAAGATANNLTITNNNFSGSMARAINANGSATTVFPGLLINNNTVGNPTAGSVDQVTSTGITVQGSTNAVISGNTMYVEGFIAASSSGHAIEVGVNSAQVSGATIEKNKVTRVKNNNPQTWPAWGINLGGGNNHIVQNNFVFDIKNDQTAGTSAFSFTFGSFGIRVGSGTGHKIYHNSVHLFGAIGGAVNNNLVASFAITATTITGVDVRDNIFSNLLTGGNPTSPNSRFVAVALPSGATSAMNLTWNNNDYVEGTDANDRMAQVGVTAGTGEFTAANFDPANTTPATNFRSYTSTLSAAGTNDNASLKVNPLFVSNTDLHLAAGSPMNNVGTPVGVLDDIDGDVRSVATPEIGADEIAGASSPTPTPTVTPGTPTPAPSATPTPSVTPTPSASVSPTPCGGVLTFNADAASLGPIPDGTVGGNICGDFGAPRDVTFTVTGVTGPLTAVQVVMTSGSPVHTWVGDLDVSLRAPGGAPTATLFKQTGEVTSVTGCGDNSDVSGPYNFFDAAPATPTFWNAATTAGAAVPVAPGNYRATTPGGSAAGGTVTTITPNFTGLTSGQINGTWTLRILDGGEGDTGAITAAQLILTGAGGCATPTPSASGTPATPTPTLTPTPSASASPSCAPGGLVVPNEYTSTQASTAGLNTFIRDTGNPRSGQLLINANQLTGLVGQSISSISLRLFVGATVPYPATAATWTDYTISMGQGVAFGSQSTTFASNFVGAPTVVRSGPLTIPAGSFPVGAPPMPFSSAIPLTTPFVYTGGNLLVEIRHSGSNIVNSTTNDFLEAALTTDANYNVNFWSATATGNTATTGAINTFTVIRLNTSGGCPSPVPGTPTPTPSATATPSPCGVSTFSNPTLITVPAGAPTVTQGAAAPYPSNITVAGTTGTVTKVTVNLNGMTSTFPGDFDLLLVGPGGQSAVIMSDAGGTTDVTNINLTLDDAAAAALSATTLAAGTFRPTNLVGVAPEPDTWPAPAPAPPSGGTSALSVFNGTNANGTWSLYVFDDANLDFHALNGGWALNISTTSGVCATPTPGTPTPTPSCPPAANVIQDGTFEAGTPWSAWTVQTSTNFGTPMCDAGCGTGGGTAGGFGGSANWAWFGGTASAETATTGQSVVIASGGPASLTFQMWIGAVATPFTDVLNVRVDGTIVGSFVEPGTAELGYTLRTIDVSAFANGASHAILFEYIGPGGAVSNFSVDNVSLVTGGACPTPTPSATPTIAPPTPTPTASASASPTATVPGTPSPTATVSGTPSPVPTVGASPTASPAVTSQAVNLSTRMRVQTGDRVGIGGFIVRGGPKTVLLRAIGPSLTRYKIEDVLADPVLELHGPTGFTTIINDNWRVPNGPAIQATGIPPTNDLESAILATLNPGAYTGIIKGNGNTSGVGLVEVYDLSPASGRLANISTRAFVGTGDNVVIAGFVLDGPTDGSGAPDSLILRGIGPSLTAAGVSSVMADPTLELRDSNGTLLISNNDWQDNAAQAALITAAGLAPSNNLESAIAATLPPGLYTALLAGLNNTTGNGLVEVYDLGATGGGPVPTPTPTPPGGTPTPSVAPSPGASPSPGSTPTPTPPGATVTPTPPPASPTPSPTTCTESFDAVTAPALPSGWTASNEGTPPDNGVVWVTNTLTPDSAPNSAFVDDQNGVSDKYMVTRNIVINSAAPKITFRNFFSTEYDPPPTEEFWDGYVLEISINGGAFADITAPAADGGGAGTFVTGGYTGEINGIASNPLAGRQAWSGENTGYINTEIDLGSHLNGQTVKLRFRMGSDLFSPGDGVHVDGLTINGGSCPP